MADLCSMWVTRDGEQLLLRATPHYLVLDRQNPWKSLRRAQPETEWERVENIFISEVVSIEIDEIAPATTSYGWKPTTGLLHGPTKHAAVTGILIVLRGGRHMLLRVDQMAPIEVKAALGPLLALVPANTTASTPPAASSPTLELDADLFLVGSRDYVELEVVGESHYQDALLMLAGPKDSLGKSVLVGTTLRCEPDNPYDRYAIRVECQGQLVGHIKATFAAMLSPGIEEHYGGVLEAPGVIVGGWDRGNGDSGSFGVRVWIPHQAHSRILGR